jgi:hypothetical protein
VPKQSKKRLSREELRSALLEAGREIVHDEGILPASSNLTFKRAFERVEKHTGIRLTHASVIGRVWDNMADFQADVLASIAPEGRRPEAGVAIDAIKRLLSHLDLSTAEYRDRALREVCRVAGAASTTAITDTTNWELWITVVAMANTASEPEQRQRIKASLMSGYKRLAEFWSQNFAVLMQLLGLRLRQYLTMAQFSEAVTSYVEGCALRQRTSDHVEIIMRPTGPNGELEEWTLLAMGIEALVDQFFEPDPDAAAATVDNGLLA